MTWTLWLSLLFFLFCCGLLGLVFTPAPLAKKIARYVLKEKKVRTRTVVVEKKVPVKSSKSPSPEGNALSLHVGELSRGIFLDAGIHFSKGKAASIQRHTPQSYRFIYRLEISLPQAVPLEDLKKNLPDLFTQFPIMEHLNGKVSPLFSQLYAYKKKRVERFAYQLKKLPTRHNLYDCETIIECHSPSGKKALFFVADMDVVSDGSDGDRLAHMPEKITHSNYYQPMTSYGWQKRSEVPNPLIEGWQWKIQQAKDALPSASNAEKKSLESRIERLQREVNDLEQRSYLIAEHDPFIVIPSFMLQAKGECIPRIGDYAVVFFGNKAYPAIVGDVGPNHKIGEASLRLAKELNANASPMSRPVSELKVSYLIFPHSADRPFGPPDYAQWRVRCAELLESFGGLGDGATLFEWDNTLPKPEVLEE